MHGKYQSKIDVEEVVLNHKYTQSRDIQSKTAVIYYRAVQLVALYLPMMRMTEHCSASLMSCR